jgi:hypothetical protein
MELETRIEDLLHRNLVRQRRYGSNRAWIQVPEVRNEEWGKDLPIAQVQLLIEAVLGRPEWYRLDVKSSEEHGIIGYEYTDAEGAALTREYSGY